MIINLFFIVSDYLLFNFYYTKFYSLSPHRVLKSNFHIIIVITKILRFLDKNTKVTFIFAILK